MGLEDRNGIAVVANAQIWSNKFRLLIFQWRRAGTDIDKDAFGNIQSNRIVRPGFETWTIRSRFSAAVIIDQVWETKLAGCGAHESQVVEYNPELEGVLDEVLASREKQKEFLFHNTYPYSKVTTNIRLALHKY